MAIASPRLRALSADATVSAGDGVSPSLAKIVSGVSPEGVSPEANTPGVNVLITVGHHSGRAGAVALLPLAFGLSLWVTSCAEPRLDGLPEDPGHNPPSQPLPTIGPPAGNSDIQQDASVAPTNTGADAGSPSEAVGPAPADAGAPGSSQATDTTGTIGVTTSGSSSTSGAATGSGSDATGTSASTDTSPSGSGSSSATDPTDWVDEDAGGVFYDAGIDQPSQPDAGSDAGDAGTDAGFDAGAEP